VSSKACQISGQSTSYRKTSYREISPLENRRVSHEKSAVHLGVCLDCYLDAFGGLLGWRKWGRNWPDASAKSAPKRYECQSKFGGCRRTGYHPDNYRNRLYIVSVVSLNGQPLKTTFVSETQLTAVIPAGSLAAGAVNNITVINPPPGGGTSGGSVAYSNASVAKHNCLRDSNHVGCDGNQLCSDLKDYIGWSKSSDHLCFLYKAARRTAGQPCCLVRESCCSGSQSRAGWGNERNIHSCCSSDN